jgi:hypothetical protein
VALKASLLASVVENDAAAILVWHGNLANIYVAYGCTESFSFLLRVPSGAYDCELSELCVCIARVHLHLIANFQSCTGT